MEDREFEQLAEDIMVRIESVLEARGIDVDLLPGGVLQADIIPKGEMIINRHAPSQEIWVAAPSGAFHFRYDGISWRDTRDGEELMGRLHLLID